MGTLITLILRSCIEDEEILENSFCSIIQSTDNNMPVCLADLNSRNWFTKSKKHQKEWRRAMRFLFPIAARNPEIFAKSMKKSCLLENGEISLLLKNDISQLKVNVQAVSDDMKTVCYFILRIILFFKNVIDFKYHR